MPANPYAEPVIAWFDRHARDLPWRRADASPWAILVSEIMLQQTPVARVLPAYEAWLRRWPTPADLAADAPGEAVRQWDRLGYPRRALNLHAIAGALVERHDGRVPASYDELLALPGVGPYTAAAVASFAFRRRHAVLDTNVRRVLARLVNAEEHPPKARTAAEQALADSLLPDDPPRAARWAAASMELGALVCTARSPACGTCPVVADCAWHNAGRPAYTGPPRRGQRYAGTDRQVRGRLLAVLRSSAGPVHRTALEPVWSDAVQRERALDALVADGLIDPLPNDTYALPGHDSTTNRA